MMTALPTEPDAGEKLLITGTCAKLTCTSSNNGIKYKYFFIMKAVLNGRSYRCKSSCNVLHFKKAEKFSSVCWRINGSSYCLQLTFH